ncbi:MAG TPA: endonuclease/exonuclease/phosphatase family protein, partial [Candidatus Hydrogenedentes bacterium]|nr:endonuclease/exonuclease/phosphatase family protein [Candidatus Hydrogenedentota bacterium]
KPGYETWYVRLPYLREIIRGYDPDLIGFQETGGVQDLDELNPDPERFAWIAFEMGGVVYGDAALMYRRDKFDALDSGQFWLNPRPRVPYGFGWKPLSMPRYVNWVRLRNRENQFEFLFVNTHFDNNTPNKEPSAPFFNEVMRIPALHLPLVITGDFNTPGDTQRYQNLIGSDFADHKLLQTAELAEIRELIPPGYPEEPPTAIPPDSYRGQIDHILLGGPGTWTVTRWTVDTRAGGAQHQVKPSDHPAVFAELQCSLR